MSRKSLYLQRVPILLKQLLDGHAVNTSDFATQFSVNRKTIWRDITNVIQPIFPNNIKYDRSTKTWIATEDLRTKKFFNIEELVVIGQLLQLSKETNQKLYQATLDLFESLHEKSSHAIYKQPSIEDIDAYREQFLEIQKAIELREKITFSIKDRKRIVHPLKIINFEIYWYLIAFSEHHNEIRTFYFKDIDNLVILDVKFDKKEYRYLEKLDYAINAFYNPNNSIEVILELDEIAYTVFKRKKLNPSQHIKKSSQENIYEMSVVVTHEMEILPLIQQWIPHVKVVEPMSLHGQILKNFQSYIE